ncbi:MAG: hypothetical protein V7655_03415 [Aequorivita antarctica]
MKKTLLLLTFLFSSLIYSQEIKSIDYNSSITFAPLEVSSSAVLMMDFIDYKEIKYTVTKYSEIVFTKEITKNEGPQALKMDLSILDKGTYEIHILINDTEVKKHTFKKV